MVSMLPICAPLLFAPWTPVGKELGALNVVCCFAHCRGSPQDFYDGYEEIQLRKKWTTIVSMVAVAIFIGTNTAYSVSRARAPILVLETPDEFGAYTGEILKAEGYNEFQVESPSVPGLTVSHLNKFDIVILTETRLTSAQRDLLSRYVQGGGNLVAFRPDKQLAPVFGISGTGTKMADGYVKIESSNDIGKGLESDTLQFHGESDKYDLNGAIVVAALYSDARTSTGKPAVVSNEFGSGHAIAFTYNLPKSIVYTRQGNYQYAGLEKDGIKGIRAADMFTDGWVNPLRNLVNQADEQMRLLSHAIEWASSFKKPLPRLWYFPELNKSLVLLTGDGEDSPEQDFDAHLADVKSKGARMTLYLKGTYIPASKVKSWLSHGFEISGHVDDTEEATAPTYKGMNDKMKSTVHAIKEAYGLEMRTVRNHWIVWCGRDRNGRQDFAAQASIEAKYGIRLDCNLYHFDQESTQGHFLGPIGNFTGSGLPMRFMDAHGKVLDVYESVTQLPDEQWGQGNLFRNFKILLDRSLDSESYTFINVNFHTNRWSDWSRVEGLQIMDYANRRGVQMWTAQRALDFLQMRDTAEFVQVGWSNNQLTFQLHIPVSGQGLTFMVPKTYGGKTITSISQDGKSQSYTLQFIKGTDYALVTTASGTYRVVVTYAGSQEGSKP
jgi:hypothetical protein